MKRYENAGVADDRSGSLADFMRAWDGAPVAPDWNGSNGSVCIDTVSSKRGFGGSRLRKAMADDFRKHRQSYKNYGAGNPDPSSELFFRRNPWLRQFFQNTGRYTSYR